MEPKATRFGYSDALLKLGEKDDRICALDADLAKSTSSARFKEKWPERFFQMGIAEQNMVDVAAGLALAGKIPFASSYAIFVTGRAWEQMRTMVCYSKLPVRIAGHAGVSVGPDGATHQALEDVAIMSVLPNMTVLSPCDYLETIKATMAAAYVDGPAYIRFGRAPIPIITNDDTPFVLGKANLVKEGSDVTIVASGIMVGEALEAAKTLEGMNINAEILNIHTIKPLDKDAILNSASKTGKVVTAEEHQLIGGLGSMVASLLGKELPTPMEMVGMDDRWGESGEPFELLKHFKCNSCEIVQAVLRVLSKGPLNKPTW